MTIPWPCSRLLKQPRRRFLYFLIFAVVFRSAARPYQLQTEERYSYTWQEGAEFADKPVHVNVNKPFNASAEFYEDEEQPFIVTIEEKVFPRPEEPLGHSQLYRYPQGHRLLADDERLPTMYRGLEPDGSG
jgi:hypothetical protein